MSIWLNMLVAALGVFLFIILVIAIKGQLRIYWALFMFAMTDRDPMKPRKDNND